MKLDDPRPVVGRRIREQRERNDLTQRTFAKALGVTVRQVQHYERGERLSLDALMRIALALKCEPGWLLTGLAKTDYEAAYLANRHYRRKPARGEMVLLEKATALAHGVDVDPDFAGTVAVMREASAALHDVGGQPPRFMVAVSNGKQTLVAYDP